MQRISDGTMAIVIVDALHVQCDNTFLDFHAGRGADACQHQAILSIDPEYNPELVPGERYETPASTPLVIDARRWHDPNGQAILETYYLKLTYTH